MKRLQQCLAEGSYLLDLKAQNLASALYQVLNYVIAKDRLGPEFRDEVERALITRETQSSTAIGHSLAVPHVYLNCFTEQAIVFVRLAMPLNLDAPDGVPTRYLFVLLGPEGMAAEHLDTLMHIVRLMSDSQFRYEIGEARTHQDVLEAFQRFLARNAPRLTGRKTQIKEALEYTGVPAGGVWRDIRRRAPHYLSDVIDGLHSKCLASSLFLFFACLAPAVTFGGVMAELTGNHIGAVEMIVASAVCGTLYALCSGQPLIILGATGPLLVFTGILYQLCVQLKLPFLETAAWIGLWTGLFTMTLALADASCLMSYFTRFTDEIFAAFISVIFIISALTSIMHIFTDHAVPYSTALLSLLLSLGTYYLAMNLSAFRRSRYLLPWIREFLADFGPTIAITAMTLVALSLHEVELKLLPVPDTLQPTAKRDWLLDLARPPMWVWFAAALPAALLTVLVYVDQNITARLVNSPDHKLRKGAAYHLDLGLVGLIIVGCSMFGLPWMVAATVRSLNHVRSLATVEEVANRDGGKRERILHVRENRLTGLTIHLLIGLSLLLLPVLKVIPMAALYGLFLFMGVVSMAGNQFLERLGLWLMDRKLYPSTHYIRNVPRRVIHKYTAIQLLCFAALAGVEISPLAILFPLFLALLVPVRIYIQRFFSPEDLRALDAEVDPEEEEMQWV